MAIPSDVERTVKELRDDIDRLVDGRWDQAANTAGGKALRSQAASILASAKKLQEAVKQNTYSPR